MNKDSHWMAEVRSIEQLRGELRVKAALLRADLRDELATLEKRWADVDRELGPVRDALGKVGASTVALLRSLRAGYERVRAAAGSHA